MENINQYEAPDQKEDIDQKDNLQHADQEKSAQQQLLEDFKSMDATEKNTICNRLTTWILENAEGTAAEVFRDRQKENQDRFTVQELMETTFDCYLKKTQNIQEQHQNIEKSINTVLSQALEEIFAGNKPPSITRFIENARKEKAAQPSASKKEEIQKQFERIHGSEKMECILNSETGFFIFKDNGQEIFAHNPQSNITLMRVGNESLGLYDYEHQRNPNLNEGTYLNLLAEKLNTPEKIALYLELFMQYVHDSADPNNPLAKGTEERHGEYWQDAKESVRRTENGRMLGDCDDYAFLTREIILRQGKPAEVIAIPNHAICAWVEKRSDGRYNAYSICTFGLDKNGNREGMPIDQKKEEGYPTAEEAMNSLMVKYGNEGLGVQNGINYRVGKTTTILDIDPTKESSDRQRNVETVVLTESLVDPQAMEAAQRINNFMRRILANNLNWYNNPEKRTQKLQEIAALGKDIHDEGTLTIALKLVDNIINGSDFSKALLDNNTIPGFDASTFLETLGRSTPEAMGNRNLLTVYMGGKINVWRSMSESDQASQQAEIGRAIDLMTLKPLSPESYDQLLTIFPLISDPQIGAKLIPGIKDYFGSRLIDYRPESVILIGQPEKWMDIFKRFGSKKDTKDVFREMKARHPESYERYGKPFESRLGPLEDPTKEKMFQTMNALESSPRANEIKSLLGEWLRTQSTIDPKRLENIGNFPTKDIILEGILPTYLKKNPNISAQWFREELTYAELLNLIKTEIYQNSLPSEAREEFRRAFET